MKDADSQRKFIVDTCDVRGQWVSLDKTWLEALARTDYPPSIRQVLGEAFVAASLLAGSIKFDGKLTLQVRGDGAVHLLVVQITYDGRMRGLARWNAMPGAEDLTSLFGADARMIITIEAQQYAEPYQGVVALAGETLSDALQNYFSTSEQLDTMLYLGINDAAAAGMLIQRLPVEERSYHDSDGWQRATMLCATLSPEELCKEHSETILTRIFHEERVRVFESSPVCFHCSCSRERTDGMLIGLGRQEVDSIVAEQGTVEITCEFCDRQFNYDVVDVEALFRGAVSLGEESAGIDLNDATRH